MAGTLADAWSRQVAGCERLGSPFTARVLQAAWGDWLAGGPLRDVLPDWPGDPWVDAVPLRVAGALHALVLDGTDQALAALYPPRRPHFDPVRGPAAVRRALDVHRDRIAAWLRSPPQTNEVGRSGVLLGGFALIARRTGLPLALLELGASAGLNSRWHRYRYELGAASWGDAASPVTIRCDWHGAPPPLPPRFEIDSAAACDVAPIDLHDAAAANRLAGYVWPDQADRLQRLQAAVALARLDALRVERAHAADFLRRHLAAARPGRATVVFHSIMWQYLAGDERDALRELLAQAGARATPDAPLARLALEVPRGAATPRLYLTLWPGNERLVLADAHPHGEHAQWHAA
jgi:hypothetical protein